jgi:hypothetical protein
VLLVLILVAIGVSYLIGAMHAGTQTVSVTATTTSVVSPQTSETTQTVSSGTAVTSTSTILTTIVETSTMTMTVTPGITSILLQITCTNTSPDSLGNYFYGYYDNGTQSYSVSSSRSNMTILIERGSQTSWSVYWGFSLSTGRMEVKATLNSGQLISDKTVKGSASISGSFSMD